MKAVVAAALLVGVATQPDWQLESSLIALTAYLDDYENALSTVVAEERLTQEINPLRRLSESQQRRVLVSDVAFMRLPGDGPWLGYREVTHVDRRALPRSGKSLVELLANPSQSAYQLAYEIAWSSAKWNLGAARTTNLPGVLLEMAHGRNRARFAYRLRGDDRIHNVRVTCIEFEEHVRPALIQSPDHRDLLTAGTLYIEPATGRLWRVDANAREPEMAVDWKYSVTFTYHKQLGMLVPETAREQFYAGAGRGVGVARYGKFRRFTTSGRILPQ